MARFQTLPDRIDCITTTIPDAAMCQNYGAVNTCYLAVSNTVTNTKQRLEVTAATGCCAWTVPANISQVFIEVWGAGGGGGGNGNCCCCSQGPGGGGGGYAAIQIATTPGCVYTVCAGSGGSMGCAACTNGGTGNPSYVAGFNLSGFCAAGGAGGLSGNCNGCPYTCSGGNWPSNSCGVIGSSTYIGNTIVACGEGGHSFGQPFGCRFENKGGSAPFNGGIGEWDTYDQCIQIGITAASGGGFPGGGAAGAASSCCCANCNCGGCGAGGFVRIWF